MGSPSARTSWGDPFFGHALFFGFACGQIFVYRLREVIETSFLAQTNRNCHIYIRLVKHHIPLNAHKDTFINKWCYRMPCSLLLSYSNNIAARILKFWDAVLN